MAEIGLIVGSDEGNTLNVAERIQQRFGKELVDLVDIADATALDFAKYDKLILGIPTWDFGQLQSDWDDFWEDLQELDFSGKTVALFGLGDQFGYGDYFLDAMGLLHEVVVERGAAIVGHWSTEGYEFDASKALVPGENQFVGLGIDQDQQDELTAQRLNEWCAQVHREFGLPGSIQPLDD